MASRPAVARPASLWTVTTPPCPAADPEPPSPSPADRPAGYRSLAEFGPVAFDPLLVDGEQAGGLARNRTEREDREFADQGHFAGAGWEYEWVDWDERLDGRRRRHDRGNGR